VSSISRNIIHTGKASQPRDESGRWEGSLATRSRRISHPQPASRSEHWLRRCRRLTADLVIIGGDRRYPPVVEANETPVGRWVSGTRRESKGRTRSGCWHAQSDGSQGSSLQWTDTSKAEKRGRPGLPRMWEGATTASQTPYCLCQGDFSGTANALAVLGLARKQYRTPERKTQYYTLLQECHVEALVRGRAVPNS
jgi:hypothetical protein